MSVHIDFARIQSAVDLLGDIVPEDRLSALKNMTINNGGRWDFPDETRMAQIAGFFEVQLFGVPAMADDYANLPKNWMTAANNMLAAQAEELAGAAT